MTGKEKGKRRTGAIAAAMALIPVGVTLIDKAEYLYGLAFVFLGTALIIYADVLNL